MSNSALMCSLACFLRGNKTKNNNWKSASPEKLFRATQPFQLRSLLSVCQNVSADVTQTVVSQREWAFSNIKASGYHLFRRRFVFPTAFWNFWLKIHFYLSFFLPSPRTYNNLSLLSLEKSLSKLYTHLNHYLFIANGRRNKLAFGFSDQGNEVETNFKVVTLKQ